MSNAPVTDEEARALLRAAAWRSRLLVVTTVLVVFVAYVLVQRALFERGLGPAVVNAAGLLVLMGLVQYFVFTPRWVRRPGAPTEAARVTRVGTTGQGGQTLVLSAGGSSVRADLPRGVTGFSRGDTVRVSPGLDTGRAIALVTPTHVTSGRRVLTLETSAP